MGAFILIWHAERVAVLRAVATAAVKASPPFPRKAQTGM
jgi:hypothetical protein